MARARNIKPAFFTNDHLAECEPLARLLFAGLWTIADRAGRLHDRPRKIKVEVLPYDDCDCDKLLNVLHSKGFIQRYLDGENQYIQIVNFEKHQNPHKHEAASTIPAPCLHSTSTLQAVPITDSFNPITDSFNPITDFLLQDSEPASPKVLAGSKRAAAISADWQMTEELKAYAMQKGLTDLQAKQEAEKFKDHWLATGKPFKDWDAVWRKWVTRSIEYRYPNGLPQPKKERRVI